MNPVLESSIEDYLVEQIEALGGICYKFVSPGRRGVPDRIAVWRGATGPRVDFIELKRAIGSLKHHQRKEHLRLARAGQHVFVLWSKEDVDDYIRMYRK